MKSKPLQYFPVLAVALILTAGPVPFAAAQDSRTLNANESDQGLNGVEVEGHVGAMRIVPSNSAGIRVQVDVKRPSDERPRGNPQNVDLRTSRRGSTLVIGLFGDYQDLEETWMLEIPAHLQVEAEMGVGDLQVQGIRGGLRAKVGVGGLRIDVPEGNINAETGVGKVNVKSATTSYSSVEVRTGVGGTRIMIDGLQIQQQRQPGPGDRISLNGNGRDRLQIHSGVGDAELTIGR
jgi:hypothetical protein